MTVENILDRLTFNTLSTKDAFDEMNTKEMKKEINYYLHFNQIANQPMNDSQLQKLNAIVGILQILYNSDTDSPISDSDYDTLQELLIDMGIPRLTGSVEINNSKKVNHKYTQLRGTLDKVYYLTTDEKRVNKSRKYLDEWISSAESRYEKNCGESIDLNDVKVMLTPKFDGSSSILEIDEKFRWITRGDTAVNLASDVTHILDIFNDVYSDEPLGTGVKFEIMVSEESKDKINKLCRENPYKNSRQIVTATLNSNEPDFKVDYIYPIPLRIIHDGDDVESIHPNLIEKFPTEICRLKDREFIRDFANTHRYVSFNGNRFRTDGVVMTILDPKIQKILGRENNINKFEVAYKFTEEYAYSRVKDVEFEVSDFGYICPVLIVNPVILKGNTVSRISLSNKERFDELDLHYGDTVKVLYDIIPYVTLDANCKRVPNGRPISFVKKCPECHERLDLDVVQVRCLNKECPSRILGRVQNYCTNLRIKNIGYSTLQALYSVGLLKKGIISLYKLKKHSDEIQDIEGFGKIKTKKMIKNIESKRKLQDYDFFGALGIDGMSITTFRLVFQHIKLSEFLDMFGLKNFDLLRAKLLTIKGIGPAKSDQLIEYLKDKSSYKEISKLLEEVTLYESFGGEKYQNGRITFTGCRPNDEMIQKMRAKGYEASETWSDKLTKMLIVPNASYTSAKVITATNKQIPIIEIKDLINVLDRESI